MKLAIILALSISYIGMAALCFLCFMRTQGRILSSKMGRRHPERFRKPLWLHAVLSLLWPLQVVGLFIDAARGGW